MPWQRDGSGLKYAGDPHYKEDVVRGLIAHLRQSRNRPERICLELEELLQSRRVSKDTVWRLSKWCDWDDRMAETARQIASELFYGNVCRRMLDQHDRPIPNASTAEADYNSWRARVVDAGVGGIIPPPPVPPPPPPPPPPDDDIYSFIAGRGYRFPDWLITDYLLSLATKPLVLLCGISGTGKTKLAQLVAEFVAPLTVEGIIDKPELELDDNEFILALTSNSPDHISFSIPAGSAPLLPWPQSDSGHDIDFALDDRTLRARIHVKAQDAQGRANSFSLSFKESPGKWLGDNDVQPDDRLRVTAVGGERPMLRATLVRAAGTQPRTSRAHIAFISVRPDWTDNRSLLGYLNPLTAQYSPTELLRLLLHAHDNPDEPHFAILDEMNLAKVEYYFSDFLSAMESGTEMVLHDSADEVTVELDGTQVTVPRRLQIPRNVFFTGTVNVDETTYMFSPKVLDRANVIEFHDVDLRSYAAGVPNADDGDFRLTAGAGLAALLKHPDGAYEWARPSDFAGLSASAKVRLLAIHDRLTQHNLHFGYRVANEVARFMNLVDKHVGPAVEAEALDTQLLQKVLPKLAGNAARLEPPLLDLYADIAHADYPAVPGAACDLPRTAAKIGRMLEALRAVGFASFVE
jgi:energy-coupling factor transporter ATP-binding protein EcfA2